MGTSIRVLHVDDDPEFADLTAQFLRRESDRFEICTETRGRAALERLDDSDQGIDCIVADYMLPDMDGLELLSAVRNRNPELPFILFTGKGSEEVASDALRGGATDYLQKQSGTQQYELLANRIRNAVETARSERQVQRSLEAIDSAGEGIGILDEDGEFSYVNRAYAEIDEHSPEELVGVHWEQLYPDDEIERFREEILRKVEQEGTWSGETVRVDADGEEVPESLTVTQLDDGGHVCIARDITERKRRERERERNERYRRQLYEITSDAEASTEEKLTRLLELGCERFGVENGHIARIDRKAGQQRIELTAGSEFVQADTVTDLSAVYCRKTIESEDILTVHNAREEGWEGDPAYEKWNIGCYIGGKLQVEEELFGTLCFVNEQPREREFTQAELAFVDLMTRWVSHIFERQRHEQTVDAYETVLDTVSEGVYVLDDDSRFTMVNDALVELTGYDREALLGTDATTVLGDEGAAPDRTRTRLHDGGAALDWVETDIRTESGERIPCEVRHRSLSESAVTERRETVGVVRDRRDRGRIEQQLRESNRRFEAVFEDPGILVGLLAPDGTVLEVNQTSLEFIEGDREAVVGEPFWTTPWWTPESRDDVREWVERAATGEYVEYTSDLTLPNGDQYSVEGTIRPVTDEQDEVKSLVVGARDITERREREREREATIQFLQTLYDVTTDPEQSFDEKLARLLEMGCETLGLSEGHLTRIDGPPEDPEQCTQTVVEVSETTELSEPGDACELSNTYCRRTIETGGMLAVSDALSEGWEDDPAYEEFGFGSYVGAEVVINDDLYGTVYFASRAAREEPFSDTERMFVRIMSKWVSYELERDRMTEELRRQNDRLEQFASVVSHDLRNPLNVIEGRLELAREERDSDHLREASQALERSLELIEDLLTLAREGDREPTLDAVDLGETVERSWQNVATGDGTLAVETERTIQADRSQLQQLLENLVRNSLEHGPAADDAAEGGGLTVTVGDLESGFYVADDGQGIPEGKREAVFESGVSTSEDGTGFGLKIVAEIADSHGWRVGVTESEGGGARFEITGVRDGDGDPL